MNHTSKLPLQLAVMLNGVENKKWTEEDHLLPRKRTDLHCCVLPLSRTTFQTCIAVCHCAEWGREREMDRGGSSTSLQIDGTMDPTTNSAQAVQGKFDGFDQNTKKRAGLTRIDHACLWHLF
eukprot:scaffold302783_cov18-Tisochrysis_lutea.AAC.1